MSTTYIGEHRIGEDIVVGLAVRSGDASGVTPTAAKMRRMERSGAKYAFTADAAITMAVTERPADGDVPAGWNITLASASTTALTAGFYGIDVKFTNGGGVDITDETGLIELTEAAL